MKAKWIDEVVEIVSADRFADWLEGLHRARQDLKAKSDRYDEILTQVNLVEFRAELAHRNAIETLERSTRLEDMSARLANESAVLENDSFEVVSQFEMQRDRTTKLWETLGAIDVTIEQAQSERERKKLQKQKQKLSEDYEREDQRKQRLWSDVERLWIRSIDCNLALRELRHKGALVRKQAEALFEAYEAESRQAQALREEADKISLERDAREEALEKAQESARSDFGCLLHEDFLYWVAREDNKVVYTVPLIDDAENYPVEIVAGQVYKTTPQGGVDAMTPVDPDRLDQASATAAGPG